MITTDQTEDQLLQCMTSSDAHRIVILHKHVRCAQDASKKASKSFIHMRYRLSVWQGLDTVYANNCLWTISTYVS